MEEEVVDSITSKLESWGYTESDIEEAANIFERYARKNNDIIDYIITDASESAPNRYDNPALDVMCLTQKNVFFILYNSERSKYSSNTIENTTGVEIETTSQRIELLIFFNNRKYKAASYDEEEFEAIRNFGLSVDRIIKN
jgi:hypothetical protein